MASLLRRHDAHQIATGLALSKAARLKVIGFAGNAGDRIDYGSRTAEAQTVVDH